jgi:hypothetical protein
MVEESATANILLTLGTSNSADQLKKIDSLDNSASRSVFKGNIIDQIRQKVRSESTNKPDEDTAQENELGLSHELDEEDSSSLASSHEPSESNSTGVKKDALTLK